ncbi:MAG: hypothetical protein ACFFDP_05045, partial [Promethearchaeota archaeon]
YDGIGDTPKSIPGMANSIDLHPLMSPPGMELIKWDEQPTNQFIRYGEPFYYDLNATAVFGIDNWWINDTANFSINNLGVITNLSTLSFEDYGLQVWVNDTLGNMLSTQFIVCVVDDDYPVISEIFQVPIIVTDLDDVNITCTASDETSGLAEVVLYFRINGGLWATISMNPINSDQFIGNIAAYPTSTFIEYYINATDNSGNWVVEDNSGSYFNYTVTSSSSSPSTPVLNDPGNILSVNDFDVSWSGSTDADGIIIAYELQVDTDSTFLTPDNIWEVTLTLQYVSRLVDGTYYFRVRAQDNDGLYSLWSNIESVEIARIFDSSRDGFNYVNPGEQPDCPHWDFGDFLAVFYSQGWGELSWYLASIAVQFGDQLHNGHCYGMSVTCLDWYLNPDHIPDAFAYASSVPFEDSWSEIEAAQTSQYFDDATYFRCFFLQLDFGIIPILSELDFIEMQISAGIPIILILYSPGDLNNPDVFHAVVAYRFERNGNQRTIYVYDPNKPFDTTANIELTVTGTAVQMSYFSAGRAFKRLCRADMPILPAMLTDFIGHFFFFIAHCPVELHVYDAEGNHVGANTTGIEFQFPALYYANDTTQLIMIPNASSSLYKVELIGTGLGSFTLFFIEMNNDSQVYYAEANGTITENEKITYNLDTSVGLCPTTPILNNPGDLDDDGDFTVTWESSEDFDGNISNYEIEIARNTGFADSQILPSFTNRLHISGLSNGTYYLRVRAKDNDNLYSNWSNIQWILVQIITEPPQTTLEPTPAIPGFSFITIILGILAALGMVLLLKKKHTSPKI